MADGVVSIESTLESSPNHLNLLLLATFVGLGLIEEIELVGVVPVESMSSIGSRDSIGSTKVGIDVRFGCSVSTFFELRMAFLLFDFENMLPSKEVLLVISEVFVTLGVNLQ